MVFCKTCGVRVQSCGKEMNSMIQASSNDSSRYCETLSTKIFHGAEIAGRSMSRAIRERLGAALQNRVRLSSTAAGPSQRSSVQRQAPLSGQSASRSSIVSDGRLPKPEQSSMLLPATTGCLTYETTSRRASGGTDDCGSARQGRFRRRKLNGVHSPSAAEADTVVRRSGRNMWARRMPVPESALIVYQAHQRRWVAWRINEFLSCPWQDRLLQRHVREGQEWRQL
ncbi:uncharacterized protein BDR25DRAFT_18154 [Lindgomyces ingoldianus]|uniref:Uncharacterized protein n=1 Tax=Lindgomyces ingoldianus TaxID=673940 RepID=A0ACB6QYF3_9PLEO|nr:uncharacterized protein BDR25DRAFT_18154 [Lindgomyces ingoldianus]KAF2472084.1 hypothetical protein BDR25DRAFT_18154 [Lindgomyces ingoldianus]